MPIKSAAAAPCRARTEVLGGSVPRSAGAAAVCVCAGTGQRCVGEEGSAEKGRGSAKDRKPGAEAGWQEEEPRRA